MLLDTFDSEAAWKDARRLLVTGSKCPVILGLSPYDTPLALWSRDVGVMPETPQTPRMKLGHHLESAILGMLAEEAGVFVEPRRWTIARHPLHPELAYSMDGFAYPAEAMKDVGMACEMPEPTALAESKNRSGFHAAEDWDGQVPADVLAQLQLGMDVCDLPAAYVGVLLSGGEFRWAKVARDEAWMDANRPALLDFARRLREEDPPEPTGSPEDRRAIVAKFPAEEADKIVPLPPEAIDLALMYRDAKDAEKRAKLAADEATNKLALLVGDAEEGLLPGNFGKVTFKTTKCPARVQEAYSFRSPRVWLKKEKTT